MYECCFFLYDIAVLLLQFQKKREKHGHTKHTPTWVWAIGVLGATVLLLVVVIIIGLACWCRKKKLPRQNNSSGDEHRNEIQCTGKALARFWGFFLSVCNHMLMFQRPPTNVMPVESFWPVNNVECVICFGPCFLNVLALCSNSKHASCSRYKVSICIKSSSCMEYLYCRRNLLSFIKIFNYTPFLVSPRIPFTCHHDDCCQLR